VDFGDLSMMLVLSIEQVFHVFGILKGGLVVDMEEVVLKYSLYLLNCF